jgi:hypothetical protein
MGQTTAEGISRRRDDDPDHEQFEARSRKAVATSREEPEEGHGDQVASRELGSEAREVAGRHWGEYGIEHIDCAIQHNYEVRIASVS